MARASEEHDPSEPEKRGFEVHDISLNDSVDKPRVPTGLEMFSAYRLGNLDPDIISTQASNSNKGEGENRNKPSTSSTRRIPPTWLKPRSAFNQRLADSAPVKTNSSTATTSATSLIAAQKTAYEPQPTQTKTACQINSKKLLVSQRQRGNPLLELIRHVAWEYADIEPDYVFSPNHCAFFLSLRYHNLSPEYIFERLQKLKSTFQLTALIVLVDVDDAHHPLKELNKFGLTQNVTVLLAWSFLEAARYVECFKALVNKPPEELQPEVAIATDQKDHLTLATDFFTSLRVVSRSDAAALLSRFGTVLNIIKADKKTLESCTGIGSTKAEKIYDALHLPLKRKNAD